MREIQDGLFLSSIRLLATFRKSFKTEKNKVLIIELHALSVKAIQGNTRAKLVQTGLNAHSTHIIYKMYQTSQYGKIFNDGIASGHSR